MCDRAKCPGIDNPFHLAEGANVAGVIPDLSHQISARSLFGQRIGLTPVKTKRLFAENVQPMLQRRLHHGGMQPRGCSYKHGIKLFGGKHFFIVAVQLEARVFCNHIRHEGRVVAQHNFG